MEHTTAARCLTLDKSKPNQQQQTRGPNEREQKIKKERRKDLSIMTHTYLNLTSLHQSPVPNDAAPISIDDPLILTPRGL